MNKHRQVLASAAILFFGILVFSCKKEAPLPQSTQTGANTWGCKVNGKNWVAEDSNEPFNRYYGVEGGYQAPLVDSIRNCVWIIAKRNDGTGIHLYLRKVSKPGTYQLAFNEGIRPGALVPYNYGYYYDRSGRYVTDVQHTGTVVVTRADTVNNIVSGTFSGTFEFTAYNSQSKQTVSITDGRFDLKTR